MLERRDHQHSRVARKNLLGAVAVMNIEIDDRHALDPVHRHRACRTYGDVVEEAKAHRAVALGMVAGRADGAERGAAFPAHDEVGSEDHRARRMPGGGQRMRVHRGVGIEVMEAAVRALGLDRRDVVAAMDEGNRVVVRGRGGVMDEIAVEARPDEPVPDGAQPVGTLGVVGPHVVLEARRVCNVGGGHDVCFVSSTATRQRGVGGGRTPDGADAPTGGV